MHVSLLDVEFWVSVYLGNRGTDCRLVVGFCENHALVLYVYLTDMEEDHSAVLTVCAVFLVYLEQSEG